MSEPNDSVELSTGSRVRSQFHQGPEAQRPPYRRNGRNKTRICPPRLSGKNDWSDKVGWLVGLLVSEGSSQVYQTAQEKSPPEIDNNYPWSHHLILPMNYRPQLNAFLEGFYEIIPKQLISIFNEQELELLISGLPNIDIDDLKQNTEYHKYQNNSLQIQVRASAGGVFADEPNGACQLRRSSCLLNTSYSLSPFAVVLEGIEEPGASGQS